MTPWDENGLKEQGAHNEALWHSHAAWSHDFILSTVTHCCLSLRLD